MSTSGVTRINAQGRHLARTLLTMYIVHGLPDTVGVAWVVTVEDNVIPRRLSAAMSMFLTSSLRVRR